MYLYFEMKSVWLWICLFGLVLGAVFATYRHEPLFLAPALFLSKICEIGYNQAPKQTKVRRQLNL